MIENCDPEQTQTTLRPPVVAGPPGAAETVTQLGAEPRYWNDVPDPTEQIGPVDPLTAPDWNVSTDTMPVWADLAYQRGNGHGPAVYAPDFGAAGMHSWKPEQAPAWPPPAGMWIALTALTVVVLALGGLLVQRMNWLPVTVPLVGKDTGVAACEVISKGGSPVPSSGKDTMSAADYRKARAIFADSRYPGIRDNGVRLMDLAWQAQGMGNEDLGALALFSDIASSYSGLTGGCSAVGYTIPSLGAK